jgi:hypothetical protein
VGFVIDGMTVIPGGQGAEPVPAFSFWAILLLSGLLLSAGLGLSQRFRS